MIGSYITLGYTKIRVVKLVPLFVTKKIEIYLFSKQTVIGYAIDEGIKKEVLISTSYIFFSIEKIKDLTAKYSIWYRYSINLIRIYIKNK